MSNMRKIIEPNNQRKKRQTLNHYLRHKRSAQAKRLRLIHLIAPRIKRLPVGNFFFDHCGFDSSFALLSNESKFRISFSFFSKWWWAGCKNPQRQGRCRRAPMDEFTPCPCGQPTSTSILGLRVYPYFPSTPTTWR